MNVPKDLQRYVGRKELRYSLKTGYLGAGKFKARLIAGQVQLIFKLLRKGNKALEKLSDNQIQEIVQNYLKSYINDNEERMYSDEPLPFEFSRESFYGYINELDFIKQDIREYLGTRAYSTVENIVNDLLKENGIDDIDKSSVSYQKLCRGILKAQLKGIDIEKKQMLGDCPDNELLPVSSESSQEESSSILLKDLIEEYTKRKIELNQWRPNTVRNHQPKINTMLQVLGNKQANQITKNDTRRLAKLLELLPPGFSNMKEYRDISSINPKDLKGKHDKTMDVSTRRDYLIFARQIFSFAEDNDCIIKNPVISGIIPDKKNNPRDQRYPFDDPEDLDKIFDPELFLEWTKDHPSRFWIPLLALYTGCRLEEIASLYCEDVFRHEGLWCIEINDNHDRKVKNQNAIRSVPLHSVLVEQLKFPQYVDKVRAQGNDRVFPDLKKENYKYSHRLSKRFGYYLRRKAKIADKKKTFHSFRHNVTDYLMRNLVEESLVEELNGRSGKTESSRTYFKGHRSDVLYKMCISKLEYEVDLTHLKQSKYVIRE
jgi:integrase